VGETAERLAARAVAAHCRLVLEAVADRCVAVKPQLACFERLGAGGWSALAEIVQDARQRGLLVIADGKRGDVEVSAGAYAQAYFAGVQTPFGRLPGLGVDALTASPLLGRDSLEPLVRAARAASAGLFVLVRTSNPGAADVQERRLATGETVSEALAALIDELGRPGTGARGLSDVGAVAGATAPQRLGRLRELMPHAILLLPGIGPQGATGRGLEPAFAPGPAGGLVAASRAIVQAFESASAASRDPGRAAAAQASRLREMLWERYA